MVHLRSWRNLLVEVPIDSIVTPLVDLLKALAHPARRRVLALLRGGELCVCQITESLGVPTSTVSEHLTELRRSRQAHRSQVLGRWFPKAMGLILTVCAAWVLWVAWQAKVARY